MAPLLVPSCLRLDKSLLGVSFDTNLLAWIVRSHIKDQYLGFQD